MLGFNGTTYSYLYFAILSSDIEVKLFWLIMGKLAPLVPFRKSVVLGCYKRALLSRLLFGWNELFLVMCLCIESTLFLEAKRVKGCW